MGYYKPVAICNKGLPQEEMKVQHQHKDGRCNYLGVSEHPKVAVK